MYQFQFNKVWYTTKDLLEMFPISRSRFYRFQDELTEKGRDLSEMGRVKIRGCENVFWCPVKFREYLEREQINKPVEYNHEQLIKDEAKVAIGVFYKQQQQRKETI